jgi:DNA-binding NarL/FixJ family response regulator
VSLTEQQRQAVALVARGWTDKRIGSALHVQPDTVKSRLRAASKRIGARTRTHLVRLALQTGEIGLRNVPTDPFPVPLTPRQVEILDLTSLGLDYREVAERLGLAPGTVHAHRTRALENAACSSATQLYVLAVHNGTLPYPTPEVPS